MKKNLLILAFAGILIALYSCGDEKEVDTGENTEGTKKGRFENYG